MNNNGEPHANWPSVPLGELLAQAKPGFACGERDKNGVIQLRMNNVDTQGRFVWSEVLRVPADKATIEEYRLLPSDVMFNNTNSTELVGKSALFREYAEPVVYSNHFTRLRVRPAHLSPSYLAAWLNHEWQRGTFAEICNRWIGQSAVKAGKLLALEIPLPPLAEQERIAARLTEQLAAVESARAAAQARLAAAEALPAAYLREVFEGPEASEWDTRRLGVLIQRHKEIIHPGDRESGEAIFVGLEHIEPTTGRRTGSLRIDLGKLTGRKPTFRKGQIVYGYLRPYLNKVWIAEFDGCSSVDQFAFDVFGELADTAFVVAFMRSETFLRRSEVVTTTGQLPRISIDEIMAVEINVPTVAEQHRVATELALRLTETERLTAILRDELAAIDALPAALLREAFNGQT